MRTRGERGVQPLHSLRRLEAVAVRSMNAIAVSCEEPRKRVGGAQGEEN